MCVGSNTEFVKRIGQTIPDTWRSGVHYIAADSNFFSPGEAVIVTRSNGDKTFGTIDKVTLTVSYIRACKYAHVYVYACVYVCVDVNGQTYDICMDIFLHTYLFMHIQPYT